MNAICNVDIFAVCCQAMSKVICRLAPCHPLDVFGKNIEALRHIAQLSCGICALKVHYKPNAGSTLLALAHYCICFAVMVADHAQNGFPSAGLKANCTLKRVPYLNLSITGGVLRMSRFIREQDIVSLL